MTRPRDPWGAIYRSTGGTNKGDRQTADDARYERFMAQASNNLLEAIRRERAA